MSAWSKKVKYIEFPVVTKPEAATIQTWKKTGAVQELLKVSSLEIATPEEPVQLVEEVEPDQPLRSLTKFRIHWEDVEFEKKHPRVSAGTEKGGEFTNKHLKDDVWAEGDFIYHMDTGYPLKVINKYGSLYAQDKAGVIYPIDSVWNHYSKVPPENSIYKGMSLTDWPDVKDSALVGKVIEEPKNKFKIGDIVVWNGKRASDIINKVVGIPSHDKIDIINLNTTKFVTDKKVWPGEETKYYKLYTGKLPEEEPGIPIHDKFEKTTYDNAAKLAKEYPAKNKFKAGDTVAYTPPLGAPGIPLTKGKVYTIKAVDNVAGVIHLDNEWMLPSSYMSIAKDKDLTKEEKPEFKVGDIIQSPQKTKYKITKVDGGLAFGFLLDSDGKPSYETEIALASMSYLKSAGYKVVDSELPTLADIIKPIKKFKVTHAERPDIPQVFNIGDKVSFRGKMYFVKYVNPEDHMVQIELAKIRHGKVTGVVTGAIVNVKPDTILPWGVKPNGKAMAVGGDEWNRQTAMRLEYDYAKVKPLLEKIAAVAVGGEGELDALPTKFDPLNETTGADYQRTQALAKIMSVERAAQLLVERGLMNDIDTARAQIKSIDERLWQSWKDSSTTENGMILQVAAADELGGRLHEYDGLKKHESIKEANRKFRDIGGFDGVKAYLRGKWETTQYLLDKAGIQTMKIYRNIAWDVPFMGSQKQDTKAFGRQYRKYGQPLDRNLGYIRYPNAVVSRNGCQSCTTDAGVANRWGGNIVFRVSAPRTAALSIPAYGINIYTEHECVLAGTAWQAYDVWNKPAPTFEEFPLDTSHMAEKMFTSPDSPYMPKIKTDLSKLLSKKGLYSGKSDAYWKKYGSQGLEDKFKPGNKVKWDYPGNDPDNVYTVVGKNDYGIKLKNSQGTNLQAKPEDLTILSKFDQIDLKKDGLDKKPKFSSGDKISGVSGSNFADTEFTVNSVNRNGTMDVTSEYGTPYTGVKPHLFQTSTKVQGKFKVGDTLNYGTVAKYEVVKGPYKTYNNDVGYDIKDSSGKIYKNEVLPSYVTKKEPLPNKYNVGDLVKGNVTGNIYKIEKIDYDMAHLVVQKLGPHDPPGKIGDTSQSHLKWIGGQYTKVEPEEPKEFKVGDTIQNHGTLNNYKIIGGPYKKENGKIGYDLEADYGAVYNDFAIDHSSGIWKVK